MKKCAKCWASLQKVELRKSTKCWKSKRKKSKMLQLIEQNVEKV